jgi:methionyl-tRNA formyltransferase
MKIVFAGTPEFAAAHLEALLAAGLAVAAVYTQPDRPAGRGRRLQESAVKRVARGQGLPVHQPPTLRDPDAVATLAGVAPDLIVVVAYGLLLPPPVLALPRLGCVNVHASLLPRWRGAAPIQRALLAGDTETGVSLMQMDAGLDTGPVLRAVRCPIEPRDTGGRLHDRLAALGARALVALVRDLESGPLPAVPQPVEGVTYAAKIDRAEAEVDWREGAPQIDRRVRAFNPSPIARTTLGDDTLRIWEAEPLPGPAAGAPGEVTGASPLGIDVATGAGTLRIRVLQLPGGRPVTAGDYLNAHPSPVGQRLGLGRRE